MNGPQLAQLVETLLMVATTLLFLWIAVPEVRPWRCVGDTLRNTLTSRRRMLYLAACSSILFANYFYLQLGIDDHFTSLIVDCRGHDYTADIHRIEGDGVAALQQALRCPPLTWFLGYVYVIVFPCLVIVLLFAFDRLRDRRGLALLLIGYTLNYLIVLPFYLWFPVREVFHFYREDLGTGAVRLLLDDIHPVVMQAYRTMSGIDNCFPSFHTSLTVTLALLSWHAGRRRFAWLITAFAAAIVFSTLYLGIHWLCDVAAGLAVGVVAYVFARWLSRPWAQQGTEPASPGGGRP